MLSPLPPPLSCSRTPSDYQISRNISSGVFPSWIVSMGHVVRLVVDQHSDVVQKSTCSSYYIVIYILLHENAHKNVPVM